MTDRTRDALQRSYSTHCADGYIPDEDETTPQDVEQTCPHCRHRVSQHLGRWCRVETGALTADGSARICCCEAVDSEDDADSTRARATSGAVRPQNVSQAPGDGKAAERRSDAPFQPGQSHPDWRQWACDQLAAKDEEIARMRGERDAAREECGHEKAMRKFVSEERDKFVKHTMDTRDERDRARDTAAALEAEVARLTAKVEQVEAVADRWAWYAARCAERDEAHKPSILWEVAARKVRAALSDTTGEATRCSTCGQPFDSPGCCKGPDGPGHTVYGGCKAGS